mmetsp:Transcript_93168/g.268120  ORF Transcript_93168/g.268120 Transcript_93168/m.268120 type:complete len:126 (-) Transcript_93168:132-509(-)
MALGSGNPAARFRGGGCGCGPAHMPPIEGIAVVPSDGIGYGAAVDPNAAPPKACPYGIPPLGIAVVDIVPVGITPVGIAVALGNDVGADVDIPVTTGAPEYTAMVRSETTLGPGSVMVDAIAVPP